LAPEHPATSDAAAAAAPPVRKTRRDGCAGRALGTV
jgi:hypothetical protein